MDYNVRLIVPHRHPEIYGKACKWLESREPGTVELDKNSGISYINGTVYITNITFSNDCDRLMFALTFPELV